jgi:HIV Tat-specific factor 1
MNYGFVDNTSASTTAKTSEEKSGEAVQPTETKLSTDAAIDDDDDDDESTQQQQAGKKRKAPAVPPKWFEIAPEQNTKVYISNLPLDITENEFSELMNKCGMVMKDVKSGKLKLKLYRDSNGQLKGDGLCHYIKVSLSITFLINLKMERERIGRRSIFKKRVFHFSKH